MNISSFKRMPDFYLIKHLILKNLSMNISKRYKIIYSYFIICPPKTLSKFKGVDRIHIEEQHPAKQLLQIYRNFALLCVAR